MPLGQPFVYVLNYIEGDFKCVGVQVLKIHVNITSWYKVFNGFKESLIVSRSLYNVPRAKLYGDAGWHISYWPSHSR